ncbi:MAG: MarR family transcriptional regulator [Desulforhabdus sp.]|nr:MarR family transcriptional regulator [Desulforhabdus sp.]
MGTHYRGDEQEVRALNAYIKLVRASNTATQRIHRHLAEAKLTISQFWVLEMLYHLGPLPHCEIARKLLQTGGNVTMIINNLERRGLVERKRSSKDRRRVAVTLSGQGHRLISEIFPRQAKEIVREMESLTASEQEELGRLCKKLGRSRKDNLSDCKEDLA